MITMNELVDLRMQQQIAHEIYRQQIMQRIPDPFPALLPLTLPRHVIMPPRLSLPAVEATLQNDDLWKQFHEIGTEMIITKSGRRMFPSMRLSLSGLEEDTNYCVLLEMVPIGDCRYKFSGSQWVPAGGAEPQSPQRMFLHPDSPATGAHWQTQPILFNKVKLTNNTLDNNGHIVLASMHKYQPRLHVIRTSDLAQIPWAPQQAFVFPETEFVAVTAYQNDRITKLKIDNNPFAKGFRESGQSRCKRKMSTSPPREQPERAERPDRQQPPSGSPAASAASSSRPVLITSQQSDNAAQPLNHEDEAPQMKQRRRSNGSACSRASLDEAAAAAALVVGGVDVSASSSTASSNNSPQAAAAGAAREAAGVRATRSPSATSTAAFVHHFQQNMQNLLAAPCSLVDLACSYFGRPQPVYPSPQLYAAGGAAFASRMVPLHAADVAVGADLGGAGASASMWLHLSAQMPRTPPSSTVDQPSLTINVAANSASPALSSISLESFGPQQLLSSKEAAAAAAASPTALEVTANQTHSPPRKKGFSISAILEESS